MKKRKPQPPKSVLEHFSQERWEVRLLALLVDRLTESSRLFSTIIALMIHFWKDFL